VIGVMIDNQNVGICVRARSITYIHN